jgi:hypothetical protein
LLIFLTRNGHKRPSKRTFFGLGIHDKQSQEKTFRHFLQQQAAF